MPTSISQRFREALQASETDEVISILLTLTHPSFAAPIRVTDNGEDLTSGGEVYTRFPFQVTTPGDTDAATSVRLSIDGTDRRIIQEIRGTNYEPIKVDLAVVLASTPDTIEVGPYSFLLRNVSYTASTVDGELQFEDILNEPYPADSFTPSRFPGCFGLASTQT